MAVMPNRSGGRLTLSVVFPRRSFSSVAWPLLRDTTVVLDVVYGNGVTPLIRAARMRGLVAVDGLGMLARQGALAFELWRDGDRAYVRPVIYYETLDQLRTLRPNRARTLPLTFKDCASGPDINRRRWNSPFMGLLRHDPFA